MENPEHNIRYISEGGVTLPTFEWEFPEYRIPRDYQGKEVKPGLQKPTKKGFYLDYQLKTSKEIPSSQHYKTSDSWSVPKKSLIKIDSKIRKMTYIDSIQLDFKRKKSTPGIGVYKLIPSQKEIEETNQKIRTVNSKLIQPPKRYFYEDIEYLSSRVPGPGNYNPHEIKQKQSMNRTEPMFWIKKHSEERKASTKKNKGKPDPAMYKPSLYGTFDHFRKTHAEPRKDSKAFGSSSRFRHYDKSAPKNLQQKRPQAATYNLTLTWKGKPSDRTKSNDKHKDWYQSTSRPRTAGIYH